MSGLLIVQDRFLNADMLVSVLGDRLADVELVSADKMSNRKLTGACRFVCSASFTEKIGGVAAAANLAREVRAEQMLIIDDNASEFALRTQMNGKCLLLDMPKSHLKQGAHDLVNPADRAGNYGLQLAATLLCDTHHIAAGDKATFTLLGLAKRVAQSDVTVFINGPTGTGKEVLSKFIHHHSSRREAGFIAINCAAIPENMLEAILFGHEKGAFTGASTANKGIFRAADGGTLMLDEISEMPIGLQSKLLRVLQEKSVTPIGSQTDIAVDVRVIATTNRNMATEIHEGRFREDLYYRLNVFPLLTTMLAERPGDILPISSVLLARHAEDAAGIPWIDDEAAQALCAHNWPGNVRELENVLQRALVLRTGNVITAADIIMDSALQSLATGELAPSIPQQMQHQGA